MRIWFLTIFRTIPSSSFWSFSGQFSHQVSDHFPGHSLMKFLIIFRTILSSSFWPFSEQFSHQVSDHFPNNSLIKFWPFSGAFPSSSNQPWKKSFKIPNLKNPISQLKKKSANLIRKGLNYENTKKKSWSTEKFTLISPSFKNVARRERENYKWKKESNHWNDIKKKRKN